MFETRERKEWVRARRSVTALTVDGVHGFKVCLETTGRVGPPDPYAGEFAAATRLEPEQRRLDVGCGSGTDEVVAALLSAEIVATGVDSTAVACTLVNAARNGAGHRIDGRVSSPFEPVTGERLDIIKICRFSGVSESGQVRSHATVLPARRPQSRSFNPLTRWDCENHSEPSYFRDVPGKNGECL